MSQEIRNLEPKALWNKFADLNAVPRPSKKECAPGCAACFLDRSCG